MKRILSIAGAGVIGTALALGGTVAAHATDVPQCGPGQATATWHGDGTFTASTQNGAADCGIWLTSYTGVDQQLTPGDYSHHQQAEEWAWASLTATPTTYSVALPDCDNVQVDAYLGDLQRDLPNGELGSAWLAGGVIERPGLECETEPPVVTPPVVTPPVVTPPTLPEKPDPVLTTTSDVIVVCEAGALSSLETVTSTDWVVGEDGVTWVPGTPVIVSQQETGERYPATLDELANGECPRADDVTYTAVTTDATCEAPGQTIETSSTISYSIEPYTITDGTVLLGYFASEPVLGEPVVLSTTPQLDCAVAPIVDETPTDTAVVVAAKAPVKAAPAAESLAFTGSSLETGAWIGGGLAILVAGTFLLVLGRRKLAHANKIVDESADI